MKRSLGQLVKIRGTAGWPTLIRSQMKNSYTRWMEQSCEWLLGFLTLQLEALLGSRS
ncbi:hypothetical protein EMIT0P228_90118 [Pseudomonas brassicacearum]